MTSAVEVERERHLVPSMPAHIASDRVTPGIV